MLYGRTILGSVVITDPTKQQSLKNALLAGSRKSNGSVSACFNPRHGIRVTHGSVVTDFVICFECKQVEIWQNGTQVTGFSTTASPRSAFDMILRQSAIPIASDSE